MKNPISARFRLQGARWTLAVNSVSAEFLSAHVQKGRWSKESVGQLYTRDLTAQEVIVERATLLSKVSAAWAWVKFDIRQAEAERAEMFKQGYYCLGLWHTHPERIPKPSSKDLRLLHNHAVAAVGLDYSGIVFAILGTCGLRVWVHDGKKLYEAEEQPT